MIILGPLLEEQKGMMPVNPRLCLESDEKTLKDLPSSSDQMDIDVYYRHINGEMKCVKGLMWLEDMHSGINRHEVLTLSVICEVSRSWQRNLSRNLVFLLILFENSPDGLTQLF